MAFMHCVNVDCMSLTAVIPQTAVNAPWRLPHRRPGDEGPRNNCRDPDRIQIILMKTVLLLVVTLLSLPCFAIEDSHYEWQSITYRTYLEEIKKEAIVTVSPQHPAKGTAIANLSVKLDKHEIKIPENVIQLFQPIHPYSICILAGEF